MRTASEQTFASPIAFTGVTPASSMAWLQHCLASVRRLIKQQQQRRALLALDRHLLEDIGVTRAEALTEARKPFWK
jgi:uncharacterized protein YjiS (DUF1127 family)